MSRKDLALIGVAALCLIAWLAVRILPYGVLLSLIGVLLGAAISAGLSWYFYQQSLRTCAIKPSGYAATTRL